MRDYWDTEKKLIDTLTVSVVGFLDEGLLEYIKKMSAVGCMFQWLDF
ncbi:TPA: hypothetical protein I8Y79_002457 [Legionella pneumophila]|nr:hypothetical protein [Legionella pneumophila]